MELAAADAAVTSTPSATPTRPILTGRRFESPESYTPKHLVEKILTSHSALEGERKLVTVMFTDVSGFTAMSERLDPEDVHGVMDQMFEVVLDTVHRHEGTINQFLGDGVMALFGAPIAHEDHAQRALRAALGIQSGLAPLREEVRRAYGVEFRVRIGINTGLVVVGAIGRDLRMDYTAVGDTTNLAARLLNLAQPGQIVISEPAWRLTRDFFMLEALGEFTVKGKAQPVRVWAVQREIRGRTRLEVSRERGLTPLAGRTQEVQTLLGAYQRAAAGQGAVALVLGEAGVGKSRLLYEFFRRIEPEGALVLEATCVSYGRAMPYRPIVELLRLYLGVLDGTPEEDLRLAVHKQLDAFGLGGGERETLLAHFAGVSAPPEFLARFEPAHLKQQTVAALREFFTHAAEGERVVLVVENVHWIDASSEEFLRGLVGALPGTRLLLVMTSRPGFEAAWLVPPLATAVELTGLDAEGVRAMASTLLRCEMLSDQLLELLNEKCAGNPLYVEELVRQLQETDGIIFIDGRADVRPGQLAVPETIHDLIAARIDRLPEHLKQVLQVASVVGRRFGVSLLSLVAGVPAQELRQGLRELHVVDFVFPSAEDPEPMYSFKHALTQDVAYAGMLERRRRAYHTAAARGLEELYATQIGEVVELIAYHFRRGQVWDKAVSYLRQAAVKAQTRSAHLEARASLQEALEALRHLPETSETREQEIDVRLELWASLYPLGEFEKMLTCLQEAEALANAVSDARRLGLVSAIMGEYFRQSGRFVEARQLAEQALVLGDKLQDVPLRLVASYVLGLACHALGDYRRASELLRAIGHSPPVEWRAGAFAGLVIGSWRAFQGMNLAWLARCLAELGEFEEGVAAGRQAVAIAEGLATPYSLAAACIALGYVSLVRGDLDTAGPVLERACSVAGHANITLLRPQATRLLGGVYLLAGRIDEGLALVRAAAAEVESRQLLMQQAAVLALLGQACLTADRLDEAAAVAHRVLALARERSQRGDEAVTLRLLGEIAGRTPGDTETAVRHYQAAIALTGELGMRPLLARSHLGLGRLWLVIGERARAEDELLAATTLFCEMDMRLWVRQTMAALSQLGRLLIVAEDRRDLYEYLYRMLGDQSISVVLDRTEWVSPAAEGDQRRDRDRIDAMLRSRGLSIA